MLYKCLDFIQKVIYPRFCLLCSQPLAGRRNLCPACAAEFPVNHNCCSICSIPLQTGRHSCARCQKKAPAFDNSFIPFRYQSPLDFLISDFKFRNNLASGKLLAQLFCEQLRDSGQPLPELVIAVPLHPQRIRQRGFNQSQILADIIARQLDIQPGHNLASRIRNTASQHELSRQQRRSNMRGAFRIANDCPATNIAIVDDVVTTGSTVNELARSLKAAGARQVQVWALARTPEK